MIGLLTKDFYLTRRMLAITVPVMWLYSWFSGVDSLLGMTGSILCFIWLPVLFMTEPPEICPVLALPIRRQDQAAPRYVLLLGIWLVASLPGLLLVIVGYNPMNGHPVEAAYLLASLILTLFTGSVAMPLMFRFPGRQSVLVILAVLTMVFLLALVPVILSSQGQLGRRPDWQPSEPILLSLIGAGLAVMMTGSLFLSRRVLAKNRTGLSQDLRREKTREPTYQESPARTPAQGANGSMVATLLSIQFGHSRGIWIGAALWVGLMAGAGMIVPSKNPDDGTSIATFNHFSIWFSGAMALMVVDMIGLDWRNYSNQDPHSLVLALPVSRRAFIAWKMISPWCLLLSGLFLALALEAIAWSIMMLVQGQIPASMEFPGWQGMVYPLLVWSLLGAAYLISNAASGFRLRTLVLIPVFLLYFALGIPLGSFKLGAWLQNQAQWCMDNPLTGFVLIVALNLTALVVSIQVFRLRPLATRPLFARNAG